jgi:hypothetical protein
VWCKYYVLVNQEIVTTKIDQEVKCMHIWNGRIGSQKLATFLCCRRSERDQRLVKEEGLVDGAVNVGRQHGARGGSHMGADRARGTRLGMGDGALVHAALPSDLMQDWRSTDARIRRSSLTGSSRRTGAPPLNLM